MDVRRTIAVALGVCAAAVLAGSAIGGLSGTWLFVLASLLFPTLLIALSLDPAERRRQRWMLVSLALLYELSAIGLLLVSDAGTARIGGVPPTVLLMILGFGLLPFLLIVVAYSRASATTDDSGDQP
jgi:hypothetical protein